MLTSRSVVKAGPWPCLDWRSKVLNNFRRDRNEILLRAGAQGKTFRDLCRTALRNWLASGVNEHDVMVLAGQTNFYLAVHKDLAGRARQSAGFRRAPGARSGFQGQAVDSESRKLFNSRDLGHGRP